MHIVPEETASFQAAPIFDATLGQQALCHDRVRVTLYGLNNSQAMMFLAAVLQYSYDYNAIGMMNMPAIRDDKRTAPEFNVISQRKTIEFEVDIYQNVARDIARQMISAVIVQKPVRGVNTRVPVGGIGDRSRYGRLHRQSAAVARSGPSANAEVLFVDPPGRRDRSRRRRRSRYSRASGST